jgi:Glycosyl transferase family 2
MKEQIAGFEVERVLGPEEIPCKKDELIVLCLVRDGEPWVRSFIEHYFSLGAKHILFLDNDSTDDTVSVASEYDNVTLLRTKLPFGADVEGTEGQNLMRRYLIERFGRNRWSLCVDIDELFDYPYSDIIGLDSLLGYLNSKSYTAVTAQMLDMFPEKLSVNSAQEIVTELKDEYRFYDISKIERSTTNKDKHAIRNNIVESDEVAVGIRGGIRANVFGYKPLLTKYPLLFSDGTLEHLSVHAVRNARVFDLTCVLFHYKFYAFALQDYWYKTIEFKRGRSRFMERRYAKYVEVLEKHPELHLRADSSREIAGVNDLLENGFLVASKDFIDWVNVEEEESLLQADPQSKPHKLATAYLEARRRERAKTLTMGRLEQRLLAHRRQEQTKEQKIEKLKQQKRKQGRDITELEKRILDQGQKIQRLRHRRQRLTKQNNRLKQQRADVAVSRTWKLVQTLRHIKGRLKSRSWS